MLIKVHYSLCISPTESRQAPPRTWVVLRVSSQPEWIPGQSSPSRPGAVEDHSNLSRPLLSTQHCRECKGMIIINWLRLQSPVVLKVGHLSSCY